MSKHAPPVNTVLEWSQRSVIAYDVASRVTKTFNTTAEAANSGVRTALVAVSRRSVFIRTMHVPNASASEVELVVRMKLGELFPLPSHELAFSVDLTDEITQEGRLAVVVAMAAADLRRLLDEMKTAGVKVQGVVPVAYGSVGLTSVLNVKNSAVVSREENGIGIDIVDQGILRYSRVASSTGSASAEVCRTFSVAGIPCGNVIAADGIHVEDVDTVSSVAPLEALAGIWPSKVPSLELPEAVALRGAKLRSSRRLISGGLLVAGVLLATTAYLDYSEQQASVTAMTSRSASALLKAQDAQKLSEGKAKQAAEIENALKRGFQPGQKLTEVIQAAANEAPEGIWLSGVTLERGKQLLMRGTAKTNEQVAEYQRRLIALAAPVSGDKKITVSPRFRDVKLAFMNNAKIDEVPVVQFSITAFPIGNIPLTDTSKKGAVKK